MAARPATSAARHPAVAAAAAAATDQVTHHVKQGEFKVCLEGDDWIGTLLGSCVSLCLRDPILNIGGLNHFLLPSAGHGAPDQASVRYGDFAIETLINTIMRAGGVRSRFEAKVFGGGRLFDVKGPGVGAQNIEFVQNFCELEEIRILSRDVGGPFARKILYQPATGRARVMRLGDNVAKSVSDRDSKYQASLKATVQKPADSSVELF